MSNNVKRRLKLWLRPTKKKVILLVIIVALLAAAGSILSKASKQAAASAAADEPAYRSVVLQKDSMADSITVTGTVASADVANVTTQQTQTVKTISVQVGDTVKKGDVICTLDTADLEKELARKQESLATDQSTAQRNYESAQESLATAQEKYQTAYQNYATAAADLEAKRSAYLPAENSIKTYLDAYNAALTAEQNAGIALNSNTQIVAAQAAVEAAQAAVAAAQGGGSQQGSAESGAGNMPSLQNSDALAQAQAQLAAAQQQLAQAQAQAADLAKAYNDAVAARQAAENSLKSAKTNCNYEALFTAYSNADQAFSTAKQSYEAAKQQVDTAEQQLQTAKDQLDNDTVLETVEQLQEQIEDCTIRATADGTITSLNATVGSSASTAGGTPLATIQNTGALKVSVNIDENDIQQMKVGQRAIIRSDSTGDKEISGTLTQLSVTTSENGFPAEVSVDDADSGLLIGVSAKVEIVLSETEGVYSVPYDAVETNDSGEKVIYVRDGNDWKELPVTTGMETSYYIEIESDELQDGMEVRVPVGSSGDASMSIEEMMSGGMIQGEVVIEGPAEGGGPAGGPDGGRGQQGGGAVMAAPVG